MGRESKGEEVQTVLAVWAIKVRGTVTLWAHYSLKAGGIVLTGIAGARRR